MAVPMRLANSTCLGLFTILSTPEASCPVMALGISALLPSAITNCRDRFPELCQGSVVLDKINASLR